jgi:hypothetical protein
MLRIILGLFVIAFALIIGAIFVGNFIRTGTK